MVRTGSVSGDIGPTIIVFEGKTKRAIFKYDYLFQNMIKPVSTFIMTENSFVTHDEWYEAKKNIICRYNQIPIIRYNLQWEILGFLEVFRYHEFESRALDM